MEGVWSGRIQSVSSSCGSAGEPDGERKDGRRSSLPLRFSRKGSSSLRGYGVLGALLALFVAMEFFPSHSQNADRPFVLLRSRPALSSSSSSQPKLKTNKTFLSSMLRSVDTHNRDLLREQAAAARGSRASADNAAASGSGSSSTRVEMETREKGRGEKDHEGLE
jgi:hypothetical protein